MAPRRARLSASALAALTMFLAGCFTVEGTLDANGSGSLELTYYLWPRRQVQGHRVVWQIPLEQYTRTEEITLTVRYTVPPEGTATPPAGHTSALTASLAWL